MKGTTFGCLKFKNLIILFYTFVTWIQKSKEKIKGFGPMHESMGGNGGGREMLRFR